MPRAPCSEQNGRPAHFGVGPDTFEEFEERGRLLRGPFSDRILMLAQGFFVSAGVTFNPGNRTVPPAPGVADYVFESPIYPFRELIEGVEAYKTQCREHVKDSEDSMSYDEALNSLDGRPCHRITSNASWVKYVEAFAEYQPACLEKPQGGIASSHAEIRIPPGYVLKWDWDERKPTLVASSGSPGAILTGPGHPGHRAEADTSEAVEQRMAIRELMGPVYKTAVESGPLPFSSSLKDKLKAMGAWLPKLREIDAKLGEIDASIPDPCAGFTTQGKTIGKTSGSHVDGYRNTRISSDIIVQEDREDGWIGLHDEMEGQGVAMSIPEARAFKLHLDRFLDGLPAGEQDAPEWPASARMLPGSLARRM